MSEKETKLKKLKSWANLDHEIAGILLLVKKLVKPHLNEKKWRIFKAVCDGFYTSLYTWDHNVHDSIDALKEGKDEVPIDFPEAPGLPEKEDDNASYFSIVWQLVRPLFQEVADKWPKQSKLMAVLVAGGEKIVEDLNGMDKSLFEKTLPPLHKHH